MNRKNGIATVAVALAMALLFFFAPTAPAQIQIADLGTGYDLIDHYGYVDYQNMGNYNVSCMLQVLIDDEIVASESRDMPIRYVAGFRCSPIKTLEFPLKTTEGNHTILVHAQAQNISLNRTFEYYAEDSWVEEDEVEENAEDEVEEDWLPCQSGLQHENSQAHSYPFWAVPLPKSTVDIKKKEAEK